MLRQWCVRSLNRRIFRHSTRFNTDPPEGNKDDNLVNYDRWQKEVNNAEISVSRRISVEEKTDFS